MSRKAKILATLLAAAASACSDENVDDPIVVPEGVCAKYCDTVMSACSGDNQVHADSESCLKACATLPEGVEGDTDKNTASCRLFHAGAAASDPATHCPHASLAGGDVCGQYCDVYCDQVMTNCGDKLYADRASCKSSCAMFPKDGELSATAGNSVQCRVFHGSFPAAGDPTTHCPHAGLTGGGACGTPCDGYCDQAMGNCIGRSELYPTRQACLLTCAAFPEGGVEGDTVQCRTLHASAPAAGDPIHCAHASWGGDNVCGSPCESYCSQVTANCADGNALYADKNECLTECAGLPAGGDFSATSGNTVQCRTFHGSYPAASDPATHCPHASLAGGGVCEDAPPPPQEVTITGQVVELGARFAGRTEAVPSASVLAYGVQPSPSTRSDVSGAFALTIPANGRVVLHANLQGYFPTYTSYTAQDANATGVDVGLVTAAWMSAIATMNGVDLNTAFACHAPALDPADSCTYGVITGQILDDGTGGNGTPSPVAGVPAAAFSVRGGANSDPWYVMGPYFLDVMGAPAPNATASMANATSGGYYVLFVEIPQTAGPASRNFKISISHGDGGAARYFGPTELSAFRPTGVTWVNIPETGIASQEPLSGIDFEVQVYPLLLPVTDGGLGCQGCHTNQGGSQPAGGLNLFGGSSVAYRSLDPALFPRRVNTVDPAASLLLKKPLYEASGVQDHPIFAFAGTDDLAYQTIYTWIAEGAKHQAVGRPISFENEVYPLLSEGAQDGGMGCNACHTNSASGFYVLGDAARLFNELVTEAADDPSNSGEVYRVNKMGSPERSLVLTNLLAGSDEPHAVKLFASTADPRYQLLYRWIVEGANE